MQQISTSLPLFIGSFKSSKNLDELRHHQITHILIVKDEKESYIKAAFSSEFVYEQVFLQNSPFENLTRVIQPTGRYSLSSTSLTINFIVITLSGGSRMLFMGTELGLIKKIESSYIVWEASLVHLL